MDKRRSDVGTDARFYVVDGELVPVPVPVPTAIVVVAPVVPEGEQRKEELAARMESFGFWDWLTGGNKKSGDSKKSSDGSDGNSNSGDSTNTDPNAAVPDAAGWNETDHPRNTDGTFKKGDGGSGSGGGFESLLQPAIDAINEQQKEADHLAKVQEAAHADQQVWLKEVTAKWQKDFDAATRANDAAQKLDNDTGNQWAADQVAADLEYTRNKASKKYPALKAKADATYAAHKEATAKSQVSYDAWRTMYEAKPTLKDYPLDRPLNVTD